LFLFLLTFVYNLFFHLHLSNFLAMHDAARFGHVDVVEALLKGGANPSIRNLKDENVIELALKQDKYDVAQVVLKYQGSKM
jgi:ankyrin repeat protein